MSGRFSGSLAFIRGITPVFMTSNCKVYAMGARHLGGGTGGRPPRNRDFFSFFFLELTNFCYIFRDFRNKVTEIRGEIRIQG